MNCGTLIASLSLLSATCCQAAVVMTTTEASLATDFTHQPKTSPIAEKTGNKLSCNDPPKLEHGYYKDGLGTGHVMRPHCDTGFRLVGGEDLVCNESTGEFMGKQPRCEDIDECSLMEDDSEDFTSSATYEDDEEVDDYEFRNCHQEAACTNTVGSFKCVCKKGYRGNGIFCESMKEEKCFVPEPPNFGIIYPINPFNVRVLCHPDYSIKGHSIIKCERGQWDKLPKCIPGWKSCGDPGVPKNGYRKGNRYHEGATVRFYCRHGYEIEGSRLRMCLEPDLLWTGTQPQCVEITKEKPEDGGVTPEKPKILHREKRV